MKLEKVLIRAQVSTRHGHRAKYILLKTRQSCKLWMSILQIRLDRVTIEVMCTDLCDIFIKSEGVISKNVFYIGRPPGGAMKGRCEKCRAKVFPWPLRIQSLIQIGAVILQNTIGPVIAPPWGRCENFQVTFLPRPSRNVYAKYHENLTLCSWFETFCSKRTNPAKFGRQS